ncbi:MAG: hypothetical protein ACO3ST_00205 [Burkholderiaceae bacterium]
MSRATVCASKVAAAGLHAIRLCLACSTATAHQVSSAVIKATAWVAVSPIQIVQELVMNRTAGSGASSNTCVHEMVLLHLASSSLAKTALVRLANVRATASVALTVAKANHVLTGIASHPLSLAAAVTASVMMASAKTDHALAAVASIASAAQVSVVSITPAS